MKQALFLLIIMTLFSFMIERQMSLECPTYGKIACTRVDLDYCKCVYPKNAVGNFAKTFQCNSPEKPFCFKLPYSPIHCECRK